MVLFFQSKYYRACTEDIYVFSREIFRFTSEIKKVISLAKSKSQIQFEYRKNIKTGDDAKNKEKTIWQITTFLFE